MWFLGVIKYKNPLKTGVLSGFTWLPKKDSNPHKQSQSLSCYLYTIRQNAFGLKPTNIIIRIYGGIVKKKVKIFLKKAIKKRKILTISGMEKAWGRGYNMLRIKKYLNGETADETVSVVSWEVF